MPTQWLRSFRPPTGATTATVVSLTEAERVRAVATLARCAVMTAQEALGAAGQVELQASDIDTQVLQTAQRGVYDQDGVKGLPAGRQHLVKINDLCLGAGVAVEQETADGIGLVKAVTQYFQSVGAQSLVLKCQSVGPIVCE